MPSLFSELKRRSVFKVAATYAVVGWLLAQVVAVVNEPFSLPDSFDTVALLALIMGFPVALVLAWAYELTPEGVKRTALVVKGKLPPKTGSELATIVVLPFKDLGGSGNGPSLADAIPYELDNSLTRVAQIRVVPGQSAMAHLGAGKDMRALAAGLNVRYVVSGTVAQAGKTIRVLAELYDAEQDKLLWSQRFDTSAEEVFATQQQIAEAITRAFGGERLRVELEEASTMPPARMAAWGLVQKARSYLLNYSIDAVKGAVPLLERAVAKDPKYAVAHAHLGLVIAESTLNGISPDSARDRARALESVNRAIQLAPNDPGVLRAAGAAHAYCGSNPTAATLLRRAVDLAPYDLGSWGYLSWPLVASGSPGDLEELHEILDRLLEPKSKHPGYPYWLYHKSVAFACQGRYEEAVRYGRTASVEQPKFGLAGMNYANALGATGDTAGARAAVSECLKTNSGMTAAFYAQLMADIADDGKVVDFRTRGLRQSGLLD